MSLDADKEDLSSDEEGSEAAEFVPEMSSAMDQGEKDDTNDEDEEQNPTEPAKANSDPVYIAGLESLAGVVAHRLRGKHPELEGDGAVQIPAWVSYYTKKGFKTPSYSFRNAATEMDKVFINMHNTGLDSGPKVVRRFVEQVQSLDVDLPVAAILEFGRLRLLTRIRSVNRARKNSRALKRKSNQEEFDQEEPVMERAVVSRRKRPGRPKKPSAAKKSRQKAREEDPVAEKQTRKGRINRRFRRS